MKAPLTERETQILAMIADGLTGPQIGRQVYLAEGTIKSHVQTILHKLDANNRAHAVSIAYQRGILSVEYQQQTMGLEVVA